MSFTLALPVIYNALAAVLLYLAEEKTPFGRLNRKVRQFIIGALFGCLAILSSTGFIGVDIGEGVIINVRDASRSYLRLSGGNNRGNYRRRLPLYRAVFRTCRNIYPNRLLGFYGRCEYFCRMAQEGYVRQ